MAMEHPGAAGREGAVSGEQQVERWADAGIAEVVEEPYYLPVGDEVEIFEAAYARRLPVMLKGPTGVGKTRFLRYMAYRLGRPLVTVACHDDLTASDLLGRYLIRGNETVWIDGPLTHAVRIGAICYLDEIVEARKDTTVVIHPLTDDRRRLRLEKTGELIVAPPEFLLVISYNPGYQSLMKNLKPSTRQRFVAIDFNFPPPEVETEIVVHESGVDRATAEALVKLAGLIRNLSDSGLEEPASTRLLVYAGHLIRSGVSPRRACDLAIAAPITDDPTVQAAVRDLVATVFPA
ncbi:CbbQ/NirQ/NorQ/GpvN family protein [Sphaerobacter thermophilus]|uniref:CbbQ/NirQ/NorQ domain protein n=1 Tax=Sphaerobacter thermophilus (strain ATCC 49802 / DSM 20745 / KCCM 41009 / NCIMB 13125 / S 6022) TaxID=479434 RepID=D1C5S5_SPHTD|nr:CbbQ/NirQ/NorQ domain protein [Sphaerobacter thermophilus DSM 20745]